MMDYELVERLSRVAKCTLEVRLDTDIDPRCRCLSCFEPTGDVRISRQDGDPIGPDELILIATALRQAGWGVVEEGE